MKNLKLKEIILTIINKIKNSMSTYPLTTNHFIVEWGGKRIGFTEVLGLSIGIDSISYRDGASPVNSPKKMPGKIKYHNVILKRSIELGDNEFYNWINTLKLNKIEKSREITLLRYFQLFRQGNSPASNDPRRNYQYG